MNPSERLESRRGFDSLQPHVDDQRLAQKQLLVLPGRPFLNSPSEGIEPAVCAKSFAKIFDQLMHFFCSTRLLTLPVPFESAG